MRLVTCWIRGVVRTSVLGLALTVLAAIGTALFATKPASAVITTLQCSVREEPLPVRCRRLEVRGERDLWKGGFSGSCVSGDRTRRLFGHGCFTSQDDCETWLRRMLSIGNGAIRMSECKPHQ